MAVKELKLLGSLVYDSRTTVMTPADSISIAAAQRSGVVAVADKRRLFDSLVTEYERKIYNVAYRMLGDAETAADVTQETFINAYRHFEQFRGDSSISTWLYRIASNLCKNKLKQRKRRQQFETHSLDETFETEDDYLTTQVADSSQAPETIIRRKELGRQIAENLLKLKPEFREMVILRDLQHLTYEQICEVTGLSLPAVKSRLLRARRELQKLLLPYLRG